MVRNISFIIKGVETSQPRLIQKAIRQNVSARKNATKMVMLKIISHYIPINCVTYKFMNDGMSKLPDPISPGISNDENKMDIEVPALVEDVSSPLPTQTLPEVEIYVYTMVIVILLREKLFTDAAYHSNFLIDRIKSFNRRSLDLLSSKAYFYFSLAYEKIEKLENIRSVLLNLYRTTCIRHDDMGQAILLNLILRNYLHYNLVNQAHTFSLRTSFPENASNNQLCRYLYYMGHIQAIQLEYSEAYQRLMLASRKVPQESAPGFSILVNKLAILVQLLMGEIPEKRIFNQSDFRIPLQPYLALTQAVRDGDLQEFNNVVKKFEGSFKVDKHRTLVSKHLYNCII
jgi:26S proteasome regulatory subunit N3